MCDGDCVCVVCVWRACVSVHAFVCCACVCTCGRDILQRTPDSESAVGLGGTPAESIFNKLSR